MSVAKNDITGVKLEVPRVTDVMRKRRRNVSVFASKCTEPI